MLSKEDLLTWIRRLELSESAQALIHHIRASDPARRVGGGCRNVSGRYPSRKMGVTIQFESHRVELAAIYEMEHDPDTLEFYDQPPSFKLYYKSAKGKPLAVLHTPDYFVLRQNSAGWEEWKTEADLCQLAERNPNRYGRDENQRWRCPPGEAYAQSFGFYYRVRSSREIDWVFQRNIQFLEDYWRADRILVQPLTRERLIAQVAAAPGLSLADLFYANRDMASPDDIYALIATDAVYVDLRAAPLTESGKVCVFPTADSAARARGGKALPSPPSYTRPVFSVCVGSTLSWDGTIWKVVNAGERMVSLLREDQSITELPWTAFEILVKEGHINGMTTGPTELIHPEILDAFVTASEEDLRVANYRFRVVGGHLFGQVPRREPPVPARTVRRWVSRYRAAEARYGSGYLGLLPRRHQSGNRTWKLPESTRRLMQEFIDKDYETLKQKTKYASWCALQRACDQQGLVAPSYKTFCRAVRQRSGFSQTLKRQGPRAAYRHEPFYLELEVKTPRHGDRPFEIGHIDHTELDVEVVCSYTGRGLGRPWLTILTDAFSRRVLAFYLTFDAPSYRSCMMVLRECVRRHGRLPQIVVVDGGREFEGTYFETLLARYECTKKTRPPAKARFGSVCERLFSTTNQQFIHNLLGNTQITRHVRQVTQSVDPKGQAAWPMAELYERLRQYLYEVYDTIWHPALSQSPRAAYTDSLDRTGQRQPRWICYAEDFLMSTLPTTRKGTAKVIAGRGVKIHHIYYWSDRLRDPEIEGQLVAVRYDPFDAGTAYVFIRHQWVACHSEYYTVFQGRSEKEVMLASKELYRRRQCHSQTFRVTAKMLAEFLVSVEAEEVLLSQRLRDRASRSVRASLSGGTATDGQPLTKEDSEQKSLEHAGTRRCAEEQTVAQQVYGEF